MLENKLVFIKLGGSVITQPRPYTLNLRKIRQLAKEIHQLRQTMGFKLVLGNGGGTFPHISAQKFRTNEGIINEKSLEGISKVENDASRLNQIIVRELIRAKENAISVQPASISISEKGKIKHFYLEPLLNYLRLNLIPVLYGDVVIDLKKGCAILSTEEIFGYLAEKLKPEKVIMLTNVEGVYISSDNKKKLIREINKDNFRELKKYFKGSGRTNVTGGMLHKVEKSIEIAKKGVEVNIIGSKKGNLEKSLRGERIGTTIKYF